MSDFTEDEIKEFVEEDLIPSIEDGVYDQHLKPIVRACFARRSLLTGGKDVMVIPEDVRSKVYDVLDRGTAALKGNVALHTVVDGHEGGYVEPSPIVRPEKKLRTASSKVPSSVSSNFIQLGTLLPVPKGKRVRLHPMERWNGKRYYRSSIVGREFVIPSSHTTSSLRNIRVRIEGVGESKFKLLMLNVPNSNQGGYRDKFLKSEPIFLPRNKVFHWLVKGDV
ncbi:MAG: hypothetical protein WBO55_10345 [Rhizobiaceae bacterium]